MSGAETRVWSRFVPVMFGDVSEGGIFGWNVEVLSVLAFWAGVYSGAGVDSGVDRATANFGEVTPANCGEATP